MTTLNLTAARRVQTRGPRPEGADGTYQRIEYTTAGLLDATRSVLFPSQPPLCSQNPRCRVEPSLGIG
jgi:hypothetical protein